MNEKIEVSTWFERNRAFVGVKVADEFVLELWDEDCIAAFDDGFLDVRDIEGSAISYAKHLGLISLRA